MIALLALLAASASRAPAAVAAPEERPAATQDAPAEKDLLAALDEGLDAREPYDRETAIATFSAATRALEDGGTSRRVARALAGALDDEALSVRAAAVEALAWGRDVETTIPALGDVLEDTIAEVDKRWTRPDDESKVYVRDGKRLVADAARAASAYADDRMVEVLADRLGALRAADEGTRNASYGSEAAMPLCEALLAIGSRDAVEVVVKRTRQYTGARREPAAQRLHELLAAFSTAHGIGPPAFVHVTFDQDWADWLDEHAAGLPESLELEAPPAAPERMRRAPADERAERPRR